MGLIVSESEYVDKSVCHQLRIAGCSDEHIKEASTYAVSLYWKKPEDALAAIREGVAMGHQLMDGPRAA